jgi:phage-related protein
MSYFEIIIYSKDDGARPVYDFIRSLEVKMRAKVFREIELLKRNGNELREPHTKFLEDGIFELRIKQGSDISRILYFFLIGRRIVLTNGFVKQSQKVPAKELELAKKYRKDYLNRIKKEG